MWDSVAFNDKFPVNDTGEVAGPAQAADGFGWGNSNIRRVCGDTAIEHDDEMFYFEVEILEPARNNQMTVGFAAPDTPSNQHVGQQRGSFGYRGWDSNNFFYSHGGLFGGGNWAKRVGDGKNGKLFAKGDVVGCGWNQKDKTILFSINGESLGVRYTDVQATKLFPCVTSTQDGKVFVNFGKTEFKCATMNSYRETVLALAAAADKLKKDANARFLPTAKVMRRKANLLLSVVSAFGDPATTASPLVVAATHSPLTGAMLSPAYTSAVDFLLSTEIDPAAISITMDESCTLARDRATGYQLLEALVRMDPHGSAWAAFAGLVAYTNDDDDNDDDNHALPSYQRHLEGASRALRREVSDSIRSLVAACVHTLSEGGGASLPIVTVPILRGLKAFGSSPEIVFLHECGLLEIIENMLLDRRGCEKQARCSSNDANVIRSMSPDDNITERYSFLASSGADRLPHLSAPNTESYWQSSNQGEKWISIVESKPDDWAPSCDHPGKEWQPCLVPTEVALHLDLVRDKDNTVQSIELLAGTSPSAKRLVDSVHIPAKYVGWVTLCLPNQSQLSRRATAAGQFL